MNRIQWWNKPPKHEEGGPLAWRPSRRIVAKRCDCPHCKKHPPRCLGCGAPVAGCHSAGLRVLRCHGCLVARKSLPHCDGGWRGRIIGSGLSCLLERAFIDQWEAENDEHAARTCILPSLLTSESDTDKMFGGKRWPTQEEWNVAARLLQWLGTNVGRSFIGEVLDRFELYRQLAEADVAEAERAQAEAAARAAEIERQVQELTGLA